MAHVGLVQCCPNTNIVRHVKCEQSFHFENLSPKSNLFQTLVCLLIFFSLFLRSVFLVLTLFVVCVFTVEICHAFPFRLCPSFIPVFLFSFTDNVITCSINNYMVETHAERGEEMGRHHAVDMMAKDKTRQRRRETEREREAKKRREMWPREKVVWFFILTGWPDAAARYYFTFCIRLCFSNIQFFIRPLRQATHNSIVVTSYHLLLVKSTATA